MCPPIYGFVPPTRHISLMQPYSFKHGGLVSPSQATLRDRLPPDDVDTVPARLQPYELVVPVKHAPLVISFLKSKNINLPNM
jgi:hypothetical protein